MAILNVWNLMNRFVFLYFVVRVTQAQGVPFSSPSLLNQTTACFEYELENECSSLLDYSVNANATTQFFLFDLVSLNISDIRMLPSTCRRPLLWYACGQLFPPCPLESEEEILCRQFEGCRQVKEICDESGFELDCPSFSIFGDDNCSNRVAEEIASASEDPIVVETCLDEEKKTIKCCPTPYTVDSGGECVVECPQYTYGKTFELAGMIFFFVLLWLGVIVVFVALFPLFAMSLCTSYPNFVLPFALIFNLISELLFCFVVFAGGPKSYLCGGEEDYLLAIDNFAGSTVAGVQMSLLATAAYFSYCLWLIHSFHTLCFVAKMRWRFFSNFVDPPIRKSIQISFLGMSLLLVTSMTLFCFIFIFTHNSPSDKRYLLPLPILFAAASLEDPLYNVVRITAIVLTSLTTLIFLVSILLILNINFRIFLVQWRALFVQTYFFLHFGFLIWFYLILDIDLVVADHIVCVASHPRQVPAPCTREPYLPTQILLFLVFSEIFLFPIVIGSVAFFTNSHVYTWWKELIFKKRMVFDSSDLPFASTSKSQHVTPTTNVD